MAARRPEPTTLTGDRVLLRPLVASDLDELWRTCGSSEVFAWVWPYRMDDRRAMESFVDRALDDASEGVRVPFVQVDRRTGAVVGSTSSSTWTWRTATSRSGGFQDRPSQRSLPGCDHYPRRGPRGSPAARGAPGRRHPAGLRVLLHPGRGVASRTGQAGATAGRWLGRRRLSPWPYPVRRRLRRLG